MLEKDKHLDIREKLLNLPKVKASENFESKLLSRINLEEANSSNTSEKTQFSERPVAGFFASIFGKRNPVIISSVSFAIVAIIIIGIYFVNPFSSEDSQMTSNDSLIESESIEAKDLTGTEESTKELVTESNEVASNDVIKETTSTSNSQSPSEFMGRGYTDSYNHRESSPTQPEPIVTESDMQRGVAPNIETRERTDSRTALPPRLSAMPNGNLKVHPGESVTSMDESQKNRSNIREINVFDRSDLETLREKIINLDN